MEWQQVAEAEQRAVRDPMADQLGSLMRRVVTNMDSGLTGKMDLNAIAQQTAGASEAFDAASVAIGDVRNLSTEVKSEQEDWADIMWREGVARWDCHRASMNGPERR